MVGATPPTLHALPCEGIQKDAEGEHPNWDTGCSKPIEAGASVLASIEVGRVAATRHRQNLMRKSKDEYFGEAADGISRSQS
jgi:hypothetical protein